MASILECSNKVSISEKATGLCWPRERLFVIRERGSFWEQWVEVFSLCGLSSILPLDTLFLAANFLFYRFVEDDVVVMKTFHDDDAISEEITNKDAGVVVHTFFIFLLVYIKSHGGSESSDHSQTTYSDTQGRLRTSARTRHTVRSSPEPGPQATELTRGSDSLQTTGQQHTSRWGRHLTCG